jgi:hypothetical protein
MRSLPLRLVFFVLVILTVPVLAHDVTISGTQTFAALDGSASDHDGSANGVFTVNDGNLVVNGAVNCNDDTTTSACNMAFNVSGDLTINAGGALYAENRSGGGAGGAITLTVGGNLALNGNAIVSTASKTSSGANGGAITANVSGDVALGASSTVDSGSANAVGGAIGINAGGIVTVDGAVLSGPSRTLLASRLGPGAALDGGTSNTVGGAITISSSTFSEPSILVGATANIVSQGADNGAGPVTIDGCGIQVRGLVAALARKDGAAPVRVRSGKDVLVDGRDLGATGTRMGRIRADAPSGTAATKGVDIFAAESIDLFGPASGSTYLITSLPGVHDSKSYGGAIRITSLGDVVNGSGKLIDDGHSAAGDTGGSVQIDAKGDVTLNTAEIRAHGDFNTNNSNRGGGSIAVRSWSGNVSWQNGVGEVRPVGSTSGLALADQGRITIDACGSINTTGTSFPVMGVATSPLPDTNTGVCSPAAPSLPSGVPPLVTCNTPPVANDTSASTNEDTTVTITLTGSDADGDALTFSIVSGPSNGSLGAVISTGPTSATVDYTPNTNYNGGDSFVFRANDGNGGTDDATAAITIAPVNDPPAFLAGPPVSALEDAGAQSYANWATGISAGPADESGQTVTFSVTNDNPSLFSVQPALSSNGTLTFTSAANANGSATLTIVAQDNGGTANGGDDTSNPQTSSVTVIAVNDEPSFTGGGNVSVNEDSGAYSAAWASSISAGPNEGSQTVSFTTANDNNALFSAQPSIAADGTLSFTVAANANGSATVTVFAQDDGGTANGGDDTSPSQTFTISVGAVNDEPSFTSGGDVTVLEDSGAYSAAWATGISAGPSDESGQTVSFSATNDNNALFSTQPAIAADGTLTFTPAANAFGTATVTVTLSDNGGTANGGDDTSPAQTFTITVGEVNDEPSFTGSGNIAVLEDAPAYSASWVSAFSAGPGESQTLTYFVSNDNNALFAVQPAIASDGTLSFTVAANANGQATVTVYAQDDGGTANGGDDTSASQTFVIEVTAVNDAPSFTSGGDVTVNEDSGTYSAAWASAISAGPANESGQSVTFNITGNTNAGLFSSAPSIAPDGTLTFTVAANASGTATITVVVQDDGGIANGGVDTSAPVSFTINVTAVNDPPSFTAGGNVTVNEDSGSYSATWATAISAGPGESQTLTFTTTNDNNALFAVQPSISSTGVLTFTPAPNAYGTANVTVTLSDGIDSTSPVSFVITVNGINDPPSATNDSWETEGNTELRVDLGAGSTPSVSDVTPSGDGVADNDADTVEGDPFTVTGIVGCADTTAPYDCSVTGGTVTMNANGSFSFQPAVGATSATFQYTVTDQPAAGAPASANATVNITIHDVIWYVNATAVAGGNGTSASPFNSFASLNGSGDADGSGDYIFVHNDAVVVGGISLETSQKLWGQGVGLVIPRNLNGNGSPAVLVAPGARSVISAATGDAVNVTAVTGVDVAGLRLVATLGNGVDVTSAFGGLAASATIRHVEVAGAGQEGIDINAYSAFGTTVQIDDTSVSSVDDAIDLLAMAGTVTFGYTNGGFIRSLTGTGITLDGSNADKLYITALDGWAIDGDSQVGVDVVDATFDANPSTAALDLVSFGVVNAGSPTNPVTGNGLVMTNVHGDLAFTNLESFAGAHGVDILGMGLYAGTTGTRVTSASGAISASAGVGLSVRNSTIGSANLNLRSVSAAGGPNGIHLDTTGSVGALIIDGDGSDVSVGGNNTGGTIQNAFGPNGSTSGIGVYLRDARATLRRMHIHDHPNYAVFGTGAVVFNLEYSTVDSTAGPATTNGGSSVPDDEEGSLAFEQWAGSGTITNCVIADGYQNNLRILNTNGADLNRLTVTGSVFGNNGLTGNNNVHLESRNAGSTLNVTLQSSTVKGARADWFNATANSGSAMDVVVDGNAFSNLGLNAHPAAAPGGNRLTLGSIGTLTYDILGNSFEGSSGEAIRVRSSGSLPLLIAGTAEGIIDGNDVGVQAIANSGSSQSSGIFLFTDGGADHTARVSNNNVYQYNSHGIRIDVGDEQVGTSIVAMTVMNNVVSTPGNLSSDFNGIHVNHGTVAATDDFTSCINISGNVVTGSGSGAVYPTNAEIRLRQRQATTVILPGYTGANNEDCNVIGFIGAANIVSASGAGTCANGTPNPPTVSVAASTQGATATTRGFESGASCALPN